MHLSEFMAKNGLRDEDVAAEIDTSRPTVSRIRRRLCRPSWDTLEKLKAFSKNQITADDFVEKGVAA